MSNSVPLSPVTSTKNPVYPLYGKSENELVLFLTKINPSPPSPSLTLTVNVPVVFAK